MSSRIKMCGPDGAGKLVERYSSVKASDKPVMVSPGLRDWRSTHHNPPGIYDDANYSYSHRRFGENPDVFERSSNPIELHAAANSQPPKRGLLARLFGGRK